MGAVTIEESDDARSIVTPNCRLVFRWRNARWSHSIEAGTGHVHIAASVEADEVKDDFRRLSSPSYQDLHVQRGDRAVSFLLVGQFGPRHFSAAISARYGESWNREDRTPGPQSTEIEFDVAHRCRERVEHLSSTYCIAQDVDRGVPNGVTMRTATEGIVARVDRSDSPMADVAIVAREASGAHVEFSRDLMPFQANARLVYRWSVQSLH